MEPSVYDERRRAADRRDVRMLDGLPRIRTKFGEARNLLAELQQETDRAQQMEVEWGQLQLEQSTWAMPARVDKIAVNKLQMRAPKGQQTRLIYSKGSHESSVRP